MGDSKTCIKLISTNHIIHKRHTITPGLGLLLCLKCLYGLIKFTVNRAATGEAPRYANELITQI